MPMTMTQIIALEKRALEAFDRGDTFRALKMLKTASTARVLLVSARPRP